MKYIIPRFALAFCMVSLLSFSLRAKEAETKESKETKESDMASLPAAVRETAQKLVGTAKVEEVEPTMEDGQQAYEVEFERDGVEMAIVISPAGKLIQTEHRLSINQAPAAIVAAAEKQFPGSKITHLKKIDKDGTAYYNVSVRADGAVKQIKCTEDGKLLPAVAAK